MPGLTVGGITPWSCDVVFHYAEDRWCVGYMQLPDPTLFPQALGVVQIAHGGGWIASSKINDWRVGPTSVLVDEDTANWFLERGIAVVWAEYPQGWQTTANARVVNPSRFPQIPRMMGKLKQFLQTHATDGYVTRSRDIKLPTEDFRYGWWGASAGAIMALWIAMQRDGYLPYDPDGQPNSFSPFAYTASHRVGWVLAIECAADLRRYGESASALPYYAWAGRLFKDTANSDTIGRTERLDTVPIDWKGASACLVALEAEYRPNLDVAVLISNGAAGSEATYANSGLTVQYTTGGLTGTPVAGETCTFGGGGTARFLYHDAANLLLHFDVLTGTLLGTLPAGSEWSGTATFATSGASATVVSYVSGSEARPDFMSETDMLAEWDADDLPIEGVSEHACAYLPAWKRERLRQYALPENADATNRDRMFCGFPYTGTVLSSGFNGAAFGWGTTSFLDETEGMLQALGVIS